MYSRVRGVPAYDKDLKTLPNELTVEGTILRPDEIICIKRYDLPGHPKEYGLALSLILTNNMYKNESKAKMIEVALLAASLTIGPLVAAGMRTNLALRALKIADSIAMGLNVIDSILNEHRGNNNKIWC
jgi:hypothetical protein